MRTSYSVVDELDIIPMNQFQRDFFLIRSAEYETYIKELRVQQGELTDPNYFDFISFAQYLTIVRSITNPSGVFEEQQPLDDDDATKNPDAEQRFQSVLVRRTIPDDQLVVEFERRVGNRILQWMDETYTQPDVQLSRDYRPSTDALLGTLTQLVKLFLINGYAWDGSVRLSKAGPGPDAVGSIFVINMVSPANVWGHQSLHRQRAAVKTDYVQKVARALLLRLGYQIGSVSVSFEGSNREVTTIAIK